MNYSGPHAAQRELQPTSDGLPPPHQPSSSTMSPTAGLSALALAALQMNETNRGPPTAPKCSVVGPHSSPPGAFLENSDLDKENSLSMSQRGGAPIKHEIPRYEVNNTAAPPQPSVTSQPRNQDSPYASVPVQHNGADTQSGGGISQLNTNAAPAQVAPVPLPSMFRYVDNHLMQSLPHHDKPSDPNMHCCVCGFLHNQSPIKTTFLPLAPCGHWIHYRCLIWRACMRINQCPMCDIELFKWEGISMITLAMRTAIGMENLQLDYPHYDYNTVMTCYTDMDQYESDCKYIEMVIKRAYARELGRVLRVPVIPEFGYPSLDGGPQAAPTANMGFGTSSSGPMNSQAGESIPAGPMGSSPNLAALFHEVFEELHRSDYPRGRWLAYETHLGLLLYGSLVAIKMKRHVEETTPWIKNTQGWREFEDSRANLANNIQFEIRGNHPEQELVRVS